MLGFHGYSFSVKGRLNSGEGTGPGTASRLDRTFPEYPWVLMVGKMHRFRLFT